MFSSKTLISFWLQQVFLKVNYSFTIILICPQVCSILNQSRSSQINVFQLPYGLYLSVFIYSFMLLTKKFCIFFVKMLDITLNMSVNVFKSSMIWIICLKQPIIWKIDRREVKFMNEEKSKGVLEYVNEWKSRYELFCCWGMTLVAMSFLDSRNQDQRCVSSPDPIHLLLGTGTEGLQGHCINGMSSLTLDQLDKDSIKLSVKKESPLWRWR